MTDLSLTRVQRFSAQARPKPCSLCALSSHQWSFSFNSSESLLGPHPSPSLLELVCAIGVDGPHHQGGTLTRPNSGRGLASHKKDRSVKNNCTRNALKERLMA